MFGLVVAFVKGHFLLLFIIMHPEAKLEEDEQLNVTGSWVEQGLGGWGVCQKCGVHVE